MADEVAVVTEATFVEVAAAAPASRFNLFLFGGALMLLIAFADPGAGLTNIPVSFFLKNKLHLKAHELAVFRLWVGVPLFASFVFGMLRDRWSGLGRGDAGLLVIFGLTTAAIWAALAFLPPTYGVLLAGLIVVTSVFQLVSGAGAGLLSTIGQRQALAGQMSALLGVAAVAPLFLVNLAGGALSGYLETKGAGSAARLLFLITAGLLVAIAALGALRPKSLFDQVTIERPQSHFFADVGRLMRHWPIYPVMAIQLLWQFGPSSGIVLQYHMQNALHGTDFQWGLWNAVFLGSFIPIFVGYGFLCQRIALKWLLWIGFVPATFQMIPLLFARTAEDAIWLAALLGVIGGLAQGALVDLAIRSCPPRLQGTMMLLFGTSIYFFSGRISDLIGAEIYDHYGGFAPTVWLTVIVYALILPLILLVPKRLTATRDGEPLPI